MILVDKKISKAELINMAKSGFGNLVKAVVDINKRIMVVDASLHADEEAFLISLGSKQRDLWGINLYPELTGEEFVEFDSMINIRPNENNPDRGVCDPKIRKEILDIVAILIK